MSDNRHILHHGNTVDMLSNDLAGVTVKGDLGLVEGLEDVVTGLCAGHSLTAETVSHPGAQLGSLSPDNQIESFSNISNPLRHGQKGGLRVQK